MLSQSRRTKPEATPAIRAKPVHFVHPLFAVRISADITLADDAITLEDLASEFGISRERVRQIEVRAFQKVQRAVKNRVAAIETWSPVPVHYVVDSIARSQIRTAASSTMIRRTPTVASGLQRGSNREAESTDAPDRGGLPRSSAEAG